jgi:DNA-directed RNA polymerase beta' subunit
MTMIKKKKKSRPMLPLRQQFDRLKNSGVRIQDIDSHIKRIDAQIEELEDERLRLYEEKEKSLKFVNENIIRGRLKSDITIRISEEQSVILKEGTIVSVKDWSVDIDGLEYLLVQSVEIYNYITILRDKVELYREED